MSDDMRVNDLVAALEEVRELIEPYMDVIDGDYGVPYPNKAMRAVQVIDNARLQSLAEHIWFAARDARKDEHLHYCAICRHGAPCSRMVRIQKGIA